MQHEGATAPPTKLGGDFSRLWLAFGIANLGDGAVLAAFPLLAHSLTSDPKLITGVTVASGLPWLLLGLVAGALVDRLDRLRVMAWANLARGGAVLLLAVATLGDRETLPLLYVIGFLLGVGETFFESAAQASIATVVPRAALPAANARLFAAEIVCATLVGPPVGAWLYSRDQSLPLVVFAATYLSAGLLLFTVRAPTKRPAATQGTSLRREIGVGFSWIASHPIHRRLAGMSGTLNFATAMSVSLLVLFARERAGMSEVQFGLLIAVFGVGGIAGGGAAGVIAQRFGQAILVRTGPLIMAAGIGLLGATDRIGAVLVGAAIFGAGVGLYNVTVNSFRQATVPLDLLGRVNGTWRVISWTATTAGAASGGLLAARFGLTAPFLVTTLVFLVAAVASWGIISTRALRDAHARVDGESAQP